MHTVIVVLLMSSIDVSLAEKLVYESPDSTLVADTQKEAPHAQVEGSRKAIEIECDTISPTNVNVVDGSGLPSDIVLSYIIIM